MVGATGDLTLIRYHRVYSDYNLKKRKAGPAGQMKRAEAPFEASAALGASSITT